MKFNKILSIIILLSIGLILFGCSEDSDSILDSNSEESKILSRDHIIFGDKVGENEIEADNVFEIGEKVNFYVKINDKIKTESVNVILSRANEDKWTKLTESSMPISGTWDEFMNGISGKIFKQTGPGTYQLKIVHNGETLAKGNFVVKE